MNLKVFILKRITVGLKKIVGLKVVKKFLFRKIFGKKNLGQKETFGVDKCCVQKYFCSKRFGFQKKFCQNWVINS